MKAEYLLCGSCIQPKKKQFKVQIICILEEIDPFYWSKVHFWKGAQKFPPHLDKIRKNSIFSSWGCPWARPLDQEESQPRVNAWHRPKYVALVNCRKRKGQEHILSDFNTLENLVLSEIPNTWVQRPRRLNKLTTRAPFQICLYSNRCVILASQQPRIHACSSEVLERFNPLLLDSQLLQPA